MCAWVREGGGSVCVVWVDEGSVCGVEGITHL